jgi:hypothetical protein
MEDIVHKSRTRRRPKIHKRTTRVTVDFPIVKHKQLKAIAALNGETLQEFILSCVDEKMHKPTKTKLEQLDDLGLLGGIDHSNITSDNYKEFIRERFESKK